MKPPRSPSLAAPKGALSVSGRPGATEMATIHIDNRAYVVDDQQNLLQQCLSLGLDLPYFCWHPAMGSVGACRQCAVKQFKDENDTKGKLVMACMVAAKDGTRISIDDSEARTFRSSITEWMMVNHPHDCPVCDEGGECHLQDMTVMTGHVYRRYRGLKRTFHNQDLGPLVNHEMNRCIQCYRCTRFYQDYAGGTDLAPLALRNTVYFGRDSGGTLESEFSGNLVEVCPTGVFTDKSLKKHYTRKWDLQTAPSICVHCSVGCNTIPGERYGVLRRIRNRYNADVNGYFLCDRGRYGYEFVTGERRLRQSMMRANRGVALEGVSREAALEHLAQLLQGGANAIGIGSPRASIESNFALRELVGAEHFFIGVGEHDAQLLRQVLAILHEGPARTPSLHEIGHADAVLVLGEDVTNTAPMIALALRQAVRTQPMKALAEKQIHAWDDHAVREAMQREHGPLFIATPAATRIDDIATHAWRAAPADIARLGHAVAHALDPLAPAPANLDEATRERAESIAAALREADRPLVVSGTGCMDAGIIDAAANVAQALCKAARPASLSFALPECNSLGMVLLGGGSLDAAFEAVRNGAADTVAILENDLYRRAEAPTVDVFLATAKHVVVIDHTAHDTGEKADLLLPAAPFAEGDGTLVNHEGRAQRYVQVYVPDGDIQDSWRRLSEIGAAATRSGVPPASFDDISRRCADAIPALAGIVDAAPPSGLRIAGQRIPREPHRASGRTSMLADRSVFEQQPAADSDSPLSFSMEGYPGQPPSALIPRYWAPGWNSVQSLNRFQQEVGGALRGGNPGVRLIEPPAQDGRSQGPGQEAIAPNQTKYRGVSPPAFVRRAGEWLLLPSYHIFGSEELSALSPPIAELAPRPALALGLEDAAELGLTDGDAVQIAVGEVLHTLPLRIEDSLPRGVAGWPAGLVGAPWLALPTMAALSKEGV